MRLSICAEGCKCKSCIDDIASAPSRKLLRKRTVRLPGAQRVNMNMVANEIVAIQPLPVPTGLTFYHDYTYGSKPE
jgi:hypothetical protein